MLYLLMKVIDCDLNHVLTLGGIKEMGLLKQDSMGEASSRDF